LERELERTVTQVEKLTVSFVETKNTHNEAIDAIKKKINSLIDRDNETQKDVYRLKLDVKDAFEWINNRAAEAPSWSSARIVKRSCY
jgi:low affinity Fe/Cu permease